MDRVAAVALLGSISAVTLPAIGADGPPPAASKTETAERAAASRQRAVPMDSRGEIIDPARSHASISRVLPSSLLPSGSASEDTDALRWLVLGDAGALPKQVSIASLDAAGQALDGIERVPVTPAACPDALLEFSVPAAGTRCGFTPFIRATGDFIDRSHPRASGRSVRAEVGGRIVVDAEGQTLASIHVGGPRKTALGPIERLRGKLRIRLVRPAPHAAPPIGGRDEAALKLGHLEVSTASGLWGQCGVHFGYGDDIDVAVVDPPPPHLLAVGCDLGLPASGGTIRFRAADKPISVTTSPGQTPTQVAHLLTLAIERAGLEASLSPNPRISPGALRTADVLVRTPEGKLVRLSPDDPESPALSSDPSLDVCLGEVDLSDGLTHFTDFDAVAGTVEERALIKAFDDHDPTTIDVFIVPSFAGSGRLGESFISGDQSSVRNSIIIDRAAIRAGARSFTLAHELGHILLDMPGHPDDYGVDSPTLLMDADAADPTIFGPRRLGIAECERMLRQSGPSAPVPLLTPWPLRGR